MSTLSVRVFTRNEWNKGFAFGFVACNEQRCFAQHFPVSSLGRVRRDVTTFGRDKKIEESRVVRIGDCWKSKKARLGQDRSLSKKLEDE